MLDFIFIFGPPAVGKMTVAQALSKKTNLKYLHNHLTIDIAYHLYDPRDVRFLKFLTILNVFNFNCFIASPNGSGLIYTDVLILNKRYDMASKSRILNLFKINNWRVSIVELRASLNIRLQRNISSNRLANKPTKREIWKSELHLLKTNEKYTYYSGGEGSIFHELINKHIIIDNENLTADDAADIIISSLKLKSIKSE